MSKLDELLDKLLDRRLDELLEQRLLARLGGEAAPPDKEAKPKGAKPKPYRSDCRPAVGEVLNGREVLKRLPGGVRVLVRCQGCHREVNVHHWTAKRNGCASCNNKGADPEQARETLARERLKLARSLPDRLTAMALAGRMEGTTAELAEAMGLGVDHRRLGGALSLLATMLSWEVSGTSRRLRLLPMSGERLHRWRLEWLDTYTPEGKTEEETQ